MRSQRMRRLALAGAVAAPERVPPAQAAALVRAYANAPGFSAVNRAMRAGVFAHLAELEVPVTLAWPEHDRLIARPSRVPGGVREVVLRGCGHMPMWDDPQQVAHVLLTGSESREATSA
jgi:pimeloyl-ACP methyl ester carboxylesterase